VDQNDGEAEEPVSPQTIGQGLLEESGELYSG